jgi:DnaJ-class molecular chaperone
MNRRNYYQVLGISAGATVKEIKEAYRKLAFEYHPDRNEGNESAADMMKQINEAYAVLSNQEKRRQYDMLLNQYGDGAQEHFRRSYSDQDIFRESDIQQIFEEMARAFGLRGFDDIFRDFHGQGRNSFERHSGGIHVKGFFFSTSGGRSPRGVGGRFFGSIANKMLHKIAGVYLPEKGADIHGRIILQPDFAREGGPYAYDHREMGKKLVVHVPPGVRDGQVIRLTGLGQGGKNGAAPGDLLLTVRLRKPLIRKIKRYFGLEA